MHRACRARCSGPSKRRGHIGSFFSGELIEGILLQNSSIGNDDVQWRILCPFLSSLFCYQAQMYILGEGTSKNMTVIYINTDYIFQLGLDSRQNLL